MALDQALSHSESLTPATGVRLWPSKMGHWSNTEMKNIVLLVLPIKQHLQHPRVALWPSPSHGCYVRGDWTSTVPGSFAGKQGKSDASAPSTKLIQCEHHAFEVSFGSAPKSLGFFTRLASTSSLFSSFREAPGLAKDGTWPTLAEFIQAVSQTQSISHWDGVPSTTRNDQSSFAPQPSFPHACRLQVPGSGTTTSWIKDPPITNLAIFMWKSMKIYDNVSLHLQGHRISTAGWGWCCISRSGQWGKILP